MVIIADEEIILKKQFYIIPRFNLKSRQYFDKYGCRFCDFVSAHFESLFSHIVTDCDTYFLERKYYRPNWNVRGYPARRLGHYLMEHGRAKQKLNHWYNCNGLIKDEWMDPNNHVNCLKCKRVMKNRVL